VRYSRAFSTEFGVRLVPPAGTLTLGIVMRAPLVRRLLALLCVLVLCTLTVWYSPLAQDGETSTAPFAFKESTINRGLSEVDRALRLDSPRAAMETFLALVREENFERAAHVLNMKSIPEEEQARRGPDLAVQLAFLLRRHNLIDWTALPDEPDARVEPGVQQGFSPYSRRSVELGQLQLSRRPVPINLQRFFVEENEPVWLFSPFAVERVPELYAEDRHRIANRWAPIRDRLDTIGRPSPYEWFAAGLLLLFSILIWLCVHWAMRALRTRLAPRWPPAVRMRKLAVPAATFVAALAFRFGTDHVFLLTGPVASNLDIGSEVVALIAGAWLLVRIASAVTLSLSERYVVPLASEDPENRRTKTTVYVVRRITMVIVALLSVGYILLQVGIFDNFGVSVLASAGALGVLVAIAARPLLGNIVAGLQIAMTDPVRIGDVVVYDGHWATVEDISFAHTVLRTWTDTRLIIPHTEFLSKAFENWSKEGEAVKRIVKIPVDYCLELDLVRRKVAEIVEGDPRATEPPAVEMVELNGETAVVWIWIAGTTAFTAWHLHNDVREKVVAFLKDLDGGAYLPRRRHVLLNMESG
jgi:small-conductance mechanosensitive channel